MDELFAQPWAAIELLGPSSLSHVSGRQHQSVRGV